MARNAPCRYANITEIYALFLYIETCVTFSLIMIVIFQKDVHFP